MFLRITAVPRLQDASCANATFLRHFNCSEENFGWQFGPRRVRRILLESISLPAGHTTTMVWSIEREEEIFNSKFGSCCLELLAWYINDYDIHERLLLVWFLR